MNWVVNYIGKQFPDAPVIDTDKGSLISESFSFWLKSPKKVGKSLSFASSL